MPLGEEAQHRSQLVPGPDVAIESADVVLVRGDPRDVVTIVKLARATYRRMVPEPLVGHGLQPAREPGDRARSRRGALLMSLSTVIVAVNARWLRLPG